MSAQGGVGGRRSKSLVNLLRAVNLQSDKDFQYGRVLWVFLEDKDQGKSEVLLFFPRV